LVDRYILESATVRNQRIGEQILNLVTIVLWLKVNSMCAVVMLRNVLFVTAKRSVVTARMIYLKVGVGIAINFLTLRRYFFGCMNHAYYLYRKHETRRSVVDRLD
jgi:hypothetical protein